MDFFSSLIIRCLVRVSCIPGKVVLHHILESMKVACSCLSVGVHAFIMYIVYWHMLHISMYIHYMCCVCSHTGELLGSRVDFKVSLFPVFVSFLCTAVL